MEDKNIDYVLPVVKKDKKDQNQNSKKLLIIIAAVIVAIGLVIGSLFLFAPKLFGKGLDKEKQSEKIPAKSFVAGAWEMTENPDIAESEDTEESESVYYVFSEVNDYGDGKWTSYYNSCVEEGDYKISEREGIKYINLGGEDLRCEFSGDNNSVLKIIFPEYKDPTTGQIIPASTYVFKKTEKPSYDKGYDKFNVDSELIGDWVSVDRELTYFTETYTYNQEVTFKDNGIMNIHYEIKELDIDVLTYLAYTVKDNQITLSPVTDMSTKHTVDYSFDADGNLKFMDETSGSLIFGDEFFGDVTYYRPENFPKSTDATESQE